MRVVIKVGTSLIAPGGQVDINLLRGMVDQLADGMVLRPAVKYQRVAQKFVPRDNH